MTIMDEKKTERITIRVAETLFNALEKLRREQRRSLSDMSTIAMTDYIALLRPDLIPPDQMTVEAAKRIVPFADDAELAAAWAALGEEYRKELRRTILAAAAREAAEKASDTAPEGPAPEDKPKTGSGAG